MLQNYSRWGVLRVFFDDPNPKEGFTIRWISKEIGLSQPSVKLHLDELSKTGQYGYPLVMREKGRTYPTYWANRASEFFRFYKKIDMIFRIRESGLLDLLSSRCDPDCIILFGSASRGEDLMGSDIDIFVASEEKKLELGRHEKGLKRKISLHFSGNFSGLPDELKNNIINGIMLQGYLKVF
ncbi:MAG: nucleotidyltransferase domain-containing protein [Candidatus Aenigmarchaeota archaeon]|nr:nucleotidyltransferase domain-containing protein [Candidatus Aenigmarchaeota archaeon]